MKVVTLAIAGLAAVAFSAGMAMAQMQPIPNPPETPHHMSHMHPHHMHYHRGHWHGHHPAARHHRGHR